MQCLVEGECQQLLPKEVGPSMVDGLIDQLTIFDSTGWSYEDLLVAQTVFAHAERCGVGTQLELHPHPVDPYDTYESVRATALSNISHRLYSA